MRELQPKVPSWAKAEHMETSVPQIDLWKYDARYEKPRIISRLFCKAFRALRIPTFPDGLRILHRVRVRQDTGRPGTIGEELAAIFFGRDAKADGVFLQRNGTVADDAVEAQTGDVQDFDANTPAILIHSGLEKEIPLIAADGEIGSGSLWSSTPLIFLAPSVIAYILFSSCVL